MDTALYQSLQQEFNKSPLNLDRLSGLLKNVMVQLTTSGLLSAPLSSLPPAQLAAIRKPSSSATIGNVLFGGVGDVLEMGAYWSVHNHDGSAFERYLTQLAPFYDETTATATATGTTGDVPKSPRMFALLGLRLLNLLVTGRRSHFYTNLAKLSLEGRKDSHIAFVIELEQCLLEGTYHRLKVAKERVPTPEYGWFVDSLIEAVRMEIAEGMEATYASISLAGAIETLLLTTQQIPLLLEFGSKRGWKHDEQRITFPTKSGSTHDYATPPSLMIQRALTYAAELEQIV